MSQIIRKILIPILGLILFQGLVAEPKQSLVDVIVTPTESDWTYQLGERADFRVKILKDGQSLPNIKISYKIGPEMMPEKTEGEKLLLNGETQLTGISMNNPGFVRCWVTAHYNNKAYTGVATAGFEPEKLQPVVSMPSDFDAFWNHTKEELAQYPIDAKMTLVPEQCTADIDVYHVNLQNIQVAWKNTSRFYGMLSVPKKEGKYPALLVVPGAGVRAYWKDDRAARGAIVFQVGIHGIPVNMPSEVYQSLGDGALGGYQNYNLHDRDSYYYKRVYLGCVRAIDFLHTLPQFDGENLAVTGGSQGGALSIVTAALDDRVDYLAAYYPALCDLPAYTKGRAGGWPHMFMNYSETQNPEWIKTIPYYDVVNFAKKLTVPGWHTWGYNDNVCPPTSLYSAYNSITAPKELHLFLKTGHWTYPEQREAANNWLFEQLKKQ